MLQYVDDDPIKLEGPHSNYIMKTIIIVLLLLIGFLFMLPQIQVLFGQLSALEQMISHMRLTHLT
jgi:hypothetical protein